MKTVEEIYQALLEDFSKRIGRDVSHSCDLAVRLYAVAAQVQALYVQMDWVQRQSFPQTAQGVYLDYHAQTRALERRAAVKATGTMRFSVRTAPQEDLAIPAGTVCLNAVGVRYETVLEAALAAGETFADVPAQAVEAGAAGNTAADTVLFLSAPPAGIVSCSNPTAFAGGEDAEDDETLRGRILDSYQRLPNGANAAFYETEAMLYPGVAAARAVGRARGIGTVDVYVATTAGVPEEALCQEIQAALERKREIAVDVQVKAPAVQTVDIDVGVHLSTGETLEAAEKAVETVLRAYFTGARLGCAVPLSEWYCRLSHSVAGGRCGGVGVCTAGAGGTLCASIGLKRRERIGVCRIHPGIAASGRHLYVCAGEHRER